MQECERFREIRGDTQSTYYPFKVFPEEAGLLPFGADDCDVWLCWKTIGDPNEWPIAVRWAWGADGMKVFDLTLSEFLHGALSREIEIPCWPTPWFVDDLRFEAYDGPL